METIYNGFKKTGLLACLCSLPVQSFATDLNEIIPSLYGGDGVTLEDNPFFSHRADFTEDSLENLQVLSETISDFAQPTISSISGLTYEFDPILDEFVPTTSAQSLGPSLTERPNTGGEGVFTFGLSFGNTKFSELDGSDLNSLIVDLAHKEQEPDILTCLAPGFPNPPPANCYSYIDDVVRLTLDLDIRNQFIGFYTNYGLSENLDIGFHIPLVHTKISVSSVASIINDPSIAFSPFGSVHAFDPINEDSPFSSASGSHTGLGDMFLHVKHFFHNSDRLDMGSFFQVRIPTGDEANLQGLDGIGGRMMLLSAATFSFEESILIPYVNVGIELNAGNSSQEKLIYDLGLEYDLSLGGKRAAAYVDFIGSNAISNKTGSGDNKYDLGLGIKFALSDRGSIFSNVIFPVNDSGLRSDVTYLFGITWSR